MVKVPPSRAVLRKSTVTLSSWTIAARRLTWMFIVWGAALLSLFLSYSVTLMSFLPDITRLVQLFSDRSDRWASILSWALSVRRGELRIA